MNIGFAVFWIEIGEGILISIQMRWLLAFEYHWEDYMYGSWKNWNELIREELQNIRQNLVEYIVNETKFNLYSDPYFMRKLINSSWRKEPYMHPDKVDFDF